MRRSLLATLLAGTALPALAQIPANLGQPGGPVQHDSTKGTDFGTDALAPMVRLHAPNGSVYGLEWQQPGGIDLWRVQTDANGALQFYSYKPPGTGAGGYAGNPLGLSGGLVTIGAPTLLTTTGAPPSSGYNSYGPVENVTNPGPGNGYGRRTDCITSATAANFEICSGVLQISRSTGITAGEQFLTAWLVNLSPQETTSNWGSFIAELNPVNRADDQGWGATRGQFARWTGGIQAVPESQTFGEAGTGRNVLFDWACVASGGTNTLNLKVKAYNCLLGEPDAIGPGGYFAYATGRSTESDAAPAGVLGVAGTWVTGLDLTAATFTGGLSARLKPGQGVAFVSGTYAAGLTSTGTGATLAPALTAAGGTQVQVGTTAAADLPLTLSGGKSGTANASISVGGNVGLLVQSAGTIYLQAGGANTITLANGLETVVGHRATLGAPPSLSNCGTSPTLSATATDRHGTVTPGTGATTCAISFAAGYATAPDVQLTGWAAATTPFVSAVTTSALTVGFGAVGKFSYSVEQ